MRSKFKCGLRPLFLVPVAMALVACTGITDRSTPPHGSYKAEIRRTAMGVPHIKADDWAGAGYGYGYAQAQDDLCTMADSFLTYRGERSRVLRRRGAAAGQEHHRPAQEHRLRLLPQARDHGRRGGAMARAQPASIRGMVEGFAAGYNRYVRELKAGAGAGNAHAACRNEAWVRPVSADDIYRRMYATNLAAGYSNFLSNIANAAPPAAKVSSREEHGAQPLALQVGGEAGVGSNMIGFGTASHRRREPAAVRQPALVLARA